MPATQALTRREREQIRHRREVLDAALDLFAAQGYASTTMQEVSQKAEFGVGTLYRLFPEGKDEIYLALKQRVVAAFELELTFALKGVLDPVEQVRRYIRASAQVYASHPREMSLYLQETAGLGFDLARGLPEDLARRYRACNDRARQALTAGIKLGLFHGLETEAALLCLRSVINGLLANWLLNQQQPPLDQTIQNIEQVFFHGLAREVAPRK